MTRSGRRTGIPDAVAQFQAEVQRLAFTAVRTVVEQEIARRRRDAPPERARPRKRGAEPRKPQLELGFGEAPQHQRQLELELPPARSAAANAAPQAGAAVEPRSEPEPSGTTDAAAAPAAEPAPPSAPVGGRGRARWTRETIVSELAAWMLSGTAIDAQFIARHGPPGLADRAGR